jgi:hypothetical protein
MLLAMRRASSMVSTWGNISLGASWAAVRPSYDSTRAKLLLAV